MNLQITQVYRTTVDRDRKPLIGKNDKPYERLSIKTQEYGSRWLSGFGSDSNLNWSQGTKVDLEVVEVVKGDNTYLNFKEINKGDLIEKRVLTLEEKVKMLENPTQSTENKERVAFDAIPTIESDISMPPIDESYEEGPQG